MSTMRERFLRRMRNDNPDWLGDPWECFAWPPGPRGLGPMIGVPQGSLGGDPPTVGAYYKNFMGVTYFRGADDPGATPYITEENKVVKNLENWRQELSLPSWSRVTEEDFASLERSLSQMDRENYLVMGMTAPGMFEFSHLVMGFEDSLVSYLTQPELMNEMLEYYTDWKLEQAKLICDRIRPDVIHSHDDWGSKRALFMHPDTWRQCIKPHFKRLYGYYKSRGVLIQHHSDCVNHEIAEDMVELGIDMWQGVIPQNNIKGVVERTGGKLCIMGGIDMQVVDLPNVPEQVIRNEVRRAIDEYASLGVFIPCIANVRAIYPRTHEILCDEMNNYGAEWMSKNN